MSFATVLDAYCNSLNCTNKEIAQRCGISPSALSRYRNGEREPGMGSDVPNRLARGIVEISRERNSADPLNADSVLSALEMGLGDTRLAQSSFGKRLDAIMSTLGVRNVDVAHLLGVDPSYLSRIRSGQRKPADQTLFAEVCSRVAAQACIERKALGDLATIIEEVRDVAKESDADIDMRSNLAEVICYWMLDNATLEADIAGATALLNYLDSIDYGQYIADLDKVEPLPVDISAFDGPHSRFYYDTEGMVESELAFLAIVEKRGDKDLILSSDKPLVVYENDDEYLASYLQGVARIIKSGCHIDVVHNIERPLADTFWTLQRWVPLYMTGLVTPHYLGGIHNRLFYHTNYVGENVAMSSEALRGYLDEGRSYVTTQPEEVAYYRRKMEHVLEKCESVLDIYHADDPEQLAAFEAVEEELRVKGSGRKVCADKLKNIHVTTYPGECVVFSFISSPVIHFVSRHPKIRYAISHMH